LELTTKMMDAATTAGVRLLIDSAVDVTVQDGAIKAVLLSSGATLPADKLVICLGPWSGVAVEDWFDLPLPIEGVKSTSLVYRNLQEVKEEPFACFCGEDDNGCHLELYPRINGFVPSKCDE
jgi:glycine/D-amino acid oxidase-like deaminating enzyme